MKIREIMSANVGVCGPRTNAAAIAEILWSRDCGAVPVVDEKGTLIGIVTDRDLAIALGTRDRRASSLEAHEVMTTNVATCKADDDVRAAIAVMQGRKVRRVPIVGATGKLEGMVSVYDIVQCSERSGADVSPAAVVKAMARLSDRAAPKIAPTPVAVA